MDIYIFILYLIAICGGLTISSLTLWFFGIKSQTRKLIEESKKLQLKINQIRSEIQTGEGEPNFVSEALGNVGIEGLIDSLGLPSVLKPLAKGFVDNLLKNPEKIKSLAQSIGVKLPNESKSEEIGLL